MAEYQKETLYGLARTMQTKGHRLIARYVFSYLFLGVALGVGVWLFAPSLLKPWLGSRAWFNTFPWWTAMPALGTLLGWEGFARGRLQSVNLHYEAQRALCEMRMEEHLAEIRRLLTASAESEKKKSEAEQA